MEQTDETLDISFAAKIIEKLVTQTQGKTRVQHVVPLLQIVKETVEFPEVPLLQFTDKVDNPVVAQRQISMVLAVQRSLEISQLQSIL